LYDLALPTAGSGRYDAIGTMAPLAIHLPLMMLAVFAVRRGVDSRRQGMAISKIADAADRQGQSITAERMFENGSVV
jgi:hypothetical protein